MTRDERRDTHGPEAARNPAFVGTQIVVRDFVHRRGTRTFFLLGGRSWQQIGLRLRRLGSLATQSLAAARAT